MRSYIAAFVIATIVAALLTPIVRYLALRFRVVSQAGTRDVHDGTIPRLGGLAICVALFAPVVGIMFVESAVARAFEDQWLRIVALAGGGVAMCSLGAIDDVRSVRALHKLAIQVAVATGAFFCGFRIDVVALPFLGQLSMGVFALPVTVIWFVGVVNAVNLIDGLDGLAAGVVFFAGFTNFVVAYIGGAVASALVMAALLGSVVGFLFYNFNPARIFMGDSGSYLLGYVLAATALLGGSQKASTAVSLLVPVVALGVPIFDTLFTMGRRYLERRPLFAPDRGHVHHRLLDLGITHRRAVLLLYGVSCILTALAIGIHLGRSWQVGLALLVATVLMIGLARFVGYFSLLHLKKRQRARVRSRSTERLRRIVPTLRPRFAKARCEEDLLSSLLEVVQNADVVMLEVEVGDEVAFQWSRDGDGRRSALASMSYPLGADSLARAKMTLSLVNDFEGPEMDPQSEILLQLVADEFAESLARLGSDLAPVPSAELSQPQQQPASCDEPVHVALKTP